VVQLTYPTPTPTATATQTPTETPTLMPSETPTETASPSPTPTETPTATPTVVPNSAPNVTPLAQQNSVVGQVISLQVVATDPENTSLTYTATGLPPGLTLNPLTGLITGTLTALSEGTHTVIITVTDAGNPAASTQITFTWLVVAGDTVG